MVRLTMPTGRKRNLFHPSGDDLNDEKRGISRDYCLKTQIGFAKQFRVVHVWVDRKTGLGN